MYMALQKNSNALQTIIIGNPRKYFFDCISSSLRFYDLYGTYAISTQYTVLPKSSCFMHFNKNRVPHAPSTEFSAQEFSCISPLKNRKKYTVK